MEQAFQAEDELMNTVVEEMEDAEKEAEYQAALERGDPFAPDGTPIPENQNDGIRPLDPRTPVTFGNPFARVNDVEEEVSANILDAALSEEELALIAELEASAASGSVNHTDVYDSMMYLSVQPRNMCGASESHAKNWCGPTCDTGQEFCLLGHVDGVDGYMNYFDSSSNKYINWGRCYPNVICMQEDQHSLILEENDECKTRKFANPCPNPCDCFRSESDIALCHDTCSRTDSVSIIACQIQRKAGKARREMKIAMEIQLLEACNYNVFYEHPLMANELLEQEALPGLFGTF